MQVQESFVVAFPQGSCGKYPKITTQVSLDCTKPLPVKFFLLDASFELSWVKLLTDREPARIGQDKKVTHFQVYHMIPHISECT